MTRLALPTGDLRREVAAYLAARGIRSPEYARGARTYRPSAEGRKNLALRVFREKDIPVQVALGQYDAGICGSVWVEELRVRFPSVAVVPLAALEFGRGGLYLAAAANGRAPSLPDLLATAGLRIVSEYPNLAEAVAQRARLRRYLVLPVWGAAEAYPPEDADLVLLATASEGEVAARGLVPLVRVMPLSAVLIAHRESLARRDLGPVLAALPGQRPEESQLCVPSAAREGPGLRRPSRRPDVVRLALPDGHQQPHARAALEAAGVRLAGYGPEQPERRPRSEWPWLECKVIRPQDMPQQVAIGNFDLAITGRDWLADHLARFPDSPVRELTDLGVGRYRLVAAVSEELRTRDLAAALARWHGEGRPVVRVASEYVNLADWFARDQHLGRYRVIPITGAAEGFVPEDAELLIEGTETGRTLSANRLVDVETLMESTTVLVGPAFDPPPERSARLHELAERLALGAGGQRGGLRARVGE